MNKVLDEAIAKVRMLNVELGKTPRNVAPGLIPGRTPRTLPYDDEKSIWRNYRHIPPGWRDKIFQTNNWLGRHNPPFDNKGFLRNVDRSFKNLQQFSDEFLRNSFTLYGIRRNFSNAVNVISSFSRTAGAAVPAIGTAGSIGKSALIGHGIPALAGGLGYWAGMRTLKSQSMQEAAANNMRYNMARHSLGEGYDDAFRAASDIAVSTGSSRVGTLDLISTLTGLNVGGTLLSQEQASYLANITAKISHASGRDMGSVGMNMQQILTSWQGIDIKELIKSVPLMGKLIQDEMRKAGSNENIYAFVRSNPQAFFRALEEFNKTVKISPVAMARGQIALNRENFFLKLEKLFEPVAKRMADINTKLYDILGDVAEEFFSNQNLDNVDSILDNFHKASKTLLGAAAKFGNAAINVGSWTVENPWTTTSGLYALFGKGSLQMKVATIVAGSIIDQHSKVKDTEKDIITKKFLELDNRKEPEKQIFPGIASSGASILFKDMSSSDDTEEYGPARRFVNNILNLKTPFHKKAFWKSFEDGNSQAVDMVQQIAELYMDENNRHDPYYNARIERQAILERAGKTNWYDVPGHIGNFGLAIGSGFSMISSWMPSDILNKYIYVPEDIKKKNDLKNKLSKQVPSSIQQYTVDKEGNIISTDSIKSLTDSFDTQSVGQSDTQTIRGMSGTTRALVINFNREIVSMPTTINANDVADIKQQLEPVMEDIVVRGLTIALNNSTRMI